MVAGVLPVGEEEEELSEEKDGAFYGYMSSTGVGGRRSSSRMRRVKLADGKRKEGERQEKDQTNSSDLFGMAKGRGQELVAHNLARFGS
ncbi:hypothetical protein AXG93_3256s1170 [Marchantia polymorpha subsp. ruderalis]|uniref:Uncharacterized protein n=1 Tax=Marchantia polymorpha subsp. ruderalis TaxID=1480154 RepID=A0A176VKN5_MARPO|nr:hypothetical protein AXG93_3256s1170 [Marchantia polymorpha subsp. ruderalis]